jgi:hypothetical protein
MEIGGPVSTSQCGQLLPFRGPTGTSRERPFRIGPNCWELLLEDPCLRSNERDLLGIRLFVLRKVWKGQ